MIFLEEHHFDRVESHSSHQEKRTVHMYNSKLPFYISVCVLIKMTKAVMYELALEVLVGVETS